MSYLLTTSLALADLNDSEERGELEPFFGYSKHRTLWQ